MLSTADRFVVREQIPARVAMARAARGERAYAMTCNDAPAAPVYFAALRTAQRARRLLRGEGVGCSAPTPVVTTPGAEGGQ